ncbi:hypothetical protein [Chitinophaga sp. 212800010-3]|uniref:DUF6630 family protein n=1 Tax=unclassified Chitinophaga TaxID=2619133 RepID=UPI002DF3481B|nr:DUF2063 domain-containing protein [Chitinophaga sp. 212800010-3]
MPEISREDFNWLTQTYGKTDGYSHIDTEEEVIHEIFHDKILIGSGFLNCASYELSYDKHRLLVRKNRLDDYRLEEKAVMIADDMSNEDEKELLYRWHLLIAELRAVEKLNGLVNAREPLAQLLLDILNEEEAEEEIAKLPDLVPADTEIIWEKLYVALLSKGYVAAFDWEELPNEGIQLLNELTPLRNKRILLHAPDPGTWKDMTAGDFARSVLDFLNRQLADYKLKIVAAGPELDEYQYFICLNEQDFRLANARSKLEELCLICFF